MTRDEVRSAAQLAGSGAAGIAQHAERIHGAIARRVFGSIGPGAAPIAATHDLVARATYGAVRVSLSSAGTLVGAALAPTISDSARPFAATRAGGLAQSIVNGLIGDDLTSADEALAISMAVRLHGDDVALNRDALAAAWPAASGSLVVFVHGLFENETSWHGVFGERLQDELDFTALHLRYNTGRPIAANGTDLDDLLRRLVAEWPTSVERLVLVGHSMGGLVVRSACQLGAEEGAKWVPLLSDVVSLASPHRGAGLARALGRAGRALRLVPEAAPWANVIDHSPGVRDLEAGVDVPGVPTAQHHIVWSRLDGVPGLVLGDLLVTPKSARGCDHADAIEVRGANHFELLTHPEVADALHRWLASPRSDRAADQA